ncbi:MAG TPA: SAM-dependent methyltransferase [Streptosporangiaceae bacterium]
MSIDVQTPNVARMYDYWLGGKDNFAADREVAEKIIEISSAGGGPTVVDDMRANRAFLGRAVRTVAETGIHQFLDLGSGLPTRDNVHEIAQQVSPRARVVYVDYDPVVCTHSRALLCPSSGVRFIQADIRRPKEILEHEDVRRTFDFGQPIAVLLCAVLHQLGDDDEPAAVLATLAEAMAPGSYLILSHLSTDSRPGDIAKGTEISKITSAPMTPRSYAQILRFFDGFEVIEPGLVNTPAWRPERPIGDVTRITRFSTIGGVGIKPAAAKG